MLEPGGSIVMTLRPGAEPATAEDVARVEAKLPTAGSRWTA